MKCVVQETADQGFYLKKNLELLHKVPNFPGMQYWEADQKKSQEWIWGILPSVFLAKLLCCQEYTKLLPADGFTSDPDIFNPAWMQWPVSLEIPGLDLLSRQNEERVEACAPVPRADLYALQSFFKDGMPPPAGHTFYVQSKMHWWWLFREERGVSQCFKIRGNIRRDGTYWVQNILLIDPSQTHELVSAVTATPPNIHSVKLPLILDYKEVGDKAGQQLQLFHCCLLPKSFLEEVKATLDSTRGPGGFMGQRAY